MHPLRLIAAGTALALGVRLAKSRHQRSLHPAGVSFSGELEVWGLGAPTGAALIDRPGRHPVTVRVSKGAGTRGARPDVLGLAIRVHGEGGGHDLLLSTSGTGRLTRFLPVPRTSFDTVYGGIEPFRTPDGTLLYLSADPDPQRPPFGRTLADFAAAAQGDRRAVGERAGGRAVAAAEGDRHAMGERAGGRALGDAEGDRAAMLVRADGRAFGRLRFGAALAPEADGALAFDPIRNHPADLRPAGPLNTIRAVSYRASRRWRHAEEVRPAVPR